MISNKKHSCRHATIKSGTQLRQDLAVQEQYKELYAKTQSFLSIVTCHYDANWIVKVDDDIYIALEKVPALLEQWDRKGVGASLSLEPTLTHSED